MRGLFIALEGSDGSGKTTVLEGLKAYFAKAGLEVIYSREPGGTPIGEEIRSILLSTKNREMTARTEALLYAASRAQHVEEKILPALAAGKILVSDRYVLSSLAYQGGGRELGLDAVGEVNRWATDGLLPDLTLFLEVDPVRVLDRKAKAQKQDRLEESGHAFFKKVYNGYIEASKSMPGLVRIDASQTKEKMVQDCLDAVEKLVQAWKEGGQE